MSEPKLRVLSLGAGVQSTTMALMAAHGEIGPMPDCAIFADTQWESKAVQEHLRWLTSDNVLPFPVHVVTAGNIRADIMAGHTKRTGRFASVPWFMQSGDGSSGMGRRQCTTHYKIEPIRRAVRGLLGEKRPKRGSVELWIGISTDEAVRMKPSRVQYIENRWPLIEQRMSRQDCLRWLERNGYPRAPKSSCVGCPFHSDVAWREMRDQQPAEWADAVEVDRVIRDGGSMRGMRGRQYMHRSLVPLDQVDLRSQADFHAGDLFGEECEGMCGV